MRAFLIDPYERRVTQVESDSLENEDIYRLIECRTFEIIHRAVGLAVRDALYVDQDARTLRPHDDGRFRVKGLILDLVGKGLVVGHTVDGDTCSARTSLNSLKRLVFF